MQRSAPLESVYQRLPPSPYAVGLLILCTFIGMGEGYDVQAMALAAPLVAKAWSLSHGSVGLLLSSSVIGQVAGSFLLSPLGDRWGRRPSILLGLLFAGLATLGGAFAPDYTSLLITRVVAGLFLGLALSNTTAIAMEVVPARWRVMAVVIVSCGLPLGGALGGILVGRLLPDYGYAAVFYVGGFATLALFGLCAAFLPESPAMLVRKPVLRARLHRVLERLGADDLEGTEITAGERPLRPPVAELFTAERRSATLLLWVLNFANLSLVYFFVMWLPSLFVGSGMSSSAAVVAMSMFSGSGIVGGLVLAGLLPRAGAIVTLGACYVGTIAAVLIFSTLMAGSTEFYIVLAVCGALIVGSQFALNAYVNMFYPADIRATGAGYALGAGRFGAILAPLVGGVVLARVPSPGAAFAIGAVPAVLSLAAILGLKMATAGPGRGPSSGLGRQGASSLS